MWTSKPDCWLPAFDSLALVLPRKHVSLILTHVKAKVDTRKAAAKLFRCTGSQR